jgi:hypothetical protein
MSRSQDDFYASGPTYPKRVSAQRTSGEEMAVPRASLAQGIPSDYSQPDDSGGTLLENDMLWRGACLVFGLACAIALVYWLWRIFNGYVDPTRMTLLLILFLIYALCVGGGWVWGKHQDAPEQERREQQIAELQTRVVQLTQRNQSLQQAMQKFSTAPPVSANPSDLNLGNKIPSPPKRISPPPSIYDQQVEPTDRSDLSFHPHEKRFPGSTEANTLDFGWRVIGASKRGFSHGYEGKYREDDFEINLFRSRGQGPVLALVAIADGVSSKDLSRRGALASVQGATMLSEQRVAPLRALLARSSNGEEVRATASGILIEALRNAHNSVERAAREARVSTEELQATLLVFLAAAPSPDRLFLASVQVGDGAIFGLRSNLTPDQPPHMRWEHLLKPQIQAAGNEVRPFMHSSEAEWEQLIRCYDLSSFVGILGMTDGIADDVEPPMASPNDPQPDQFSMVDKFHQHYVAPALQSSRPADELLKLIGYHKKQSYDDRTLVYLYRQ